LSTIKKVCRRVDHIGSATLRKQGSRRPATAFSWVNSQNLKGENDGYSWKN